MLDKKGKRFIQQIGGIFLFLGREVDSILLCPVSLIVASLPTENTMIQTLHSIDYAATQENTVLTYNASEMKLAAYSDASYFNEPKARSRAGGNFFSSSNS